MGAIGYSSPIRLGPTYILPAIEIRLLGSFHPDSSKTERLVCVESDSRTDIASSTRLVVGKSPSLPCQLLTEIIVL